MDRLRAKMLETFVKRLREALQYELVQLSTSTRCAEQFEKFGPCCSHRECHAIYRIKRALASTNIDMYLTKEDK